MYQLINVSENVKHHVIRRISDNAFIPMDPENTDYKEYLKWIAEGNEPLPLDTPETSE